MKRGLYVVVLTVLLVTLAIPALAQSDPTPADLAAAIDGAWVAIAAALVMLMQAGFALLEAGFTRAKNTANIVMKNMMDFSIGAVVYWAIGFGLAYGGTSLGGFVAFGDFFYGGEDALGWFFQVVFAATAATIVSGAMAERTKFSAYLLYTPFITGVIYPIVTHWVWGGGFLSEMGYIDFAGSGAVHLVGGTAALAGVLTVGPRIGKYDSAGKPLPIPGHSLLLGALGVFILWFGWYGFNAGSTLGVVGQNIGHILMTTTLAAAAGACSAMVTAWAYPVYGKPDVGLTLNGVLGGLVGITAGCATVGVGASVIIGLIAGVITTVGIILIERAGIDDPVGAIAVHGVSGAWGVLAVGLFDSIGGTGLFAGGGIEQLGIQALGVVVIFAWTFVTSSIVFRLIKSVWGLRVTPDEEASGLDGLEHGAEAYPEFMDTLTDDQVEQAGLRTSV